MLKDLLNSPLGIKLISIILGLGLASLFRNICKDGKCIIYKGPSKDDIDNYYFKLKDSDDTCYKYNAYKVPCNVSPSESESNFVKENELVN